MDSKPRRTPSGTKCANVLSPCKKASTSLGILLMASALFLNLFSKDLMDRLIKNVCEEKKTISGVPFEIAQVLLRQQSGRMRGELALDRTDLDADGPENSHKCEELLLSDSSKSHELWVESPFPIYIDFYFFNWTNPSDLQPPKQKPRLQEIGPFRFREIVKKVDIKWNPNGTVTYKKLRKWIFQAQSSAGSLDDVVTSLNVIALTATRTTKYWNKMLRIPLSLTVAATQKMHITKKTRELLFEGYVDPLIEFASKIPGLSSQVPYDKFGWFYKRNNSKEFDGVFNMETGANGLEVFGKLRFWNYVNRTRFYRDRCGDVTGSAGEFWPPQRPKNENVVLFSPDMCRYISFRYKKEEMIGGLAGYRYESGSDLFDNGTSNLENKCFCAGDCPPSGSVNVSTCRFGAPAFVSYPHFYLADSFYSNSVEGMRPDRGKHDTYIILDQTWGIPLEVAVRLQINLLVEPDTEIRMYKNAQKMFFPVMWFDQKVTIPENARSNIEFALKLPRMIWITSIGFYAVGFSCVLAVLLSIPMKKRVKAKSKSENNLK